MQHHRSVGCAVTRRPAEGGRRITLAPADAGAALIRPTRGLQLDQGFRLLGGEWRVDKLVGRGVRDDGVKRTDLIRQHALPTIEVVTHAARDALRYAGPFGSSCDRLRIG